MPRVNQIRQREYALRRARELARSGRFSNWLAIEKELRFEEWVPEAPFCLDDERIREELDRMCAEARKGGVNA